MKQTYLEIGRVVGVHGLKGDCRLQYWCDDLAFLKGLSRLFETPGGNALTVQRVTGSGAVALVKFRGFDTREAAETLRGKVLYMAREDAHLEDGRYFISELIGCRVSDADTGELLGEITDVSATGANDVWEIRRGERLYYLPAIPACVVSVDVAENRALVRPLKGIFDDED